MTAQVFYLWTCWLIRMALIVACLRHIAVSSEDCSRYVDSGQHQSGTFSSPNYPHDYPSDVVCQYTFQAHARQRVQITFTDFLLRHHAHRRYDDSRSCDEVDTLSASVTSSDGVRSDIGIYCADDQPPMLMSGAPGGTLYITLRSRIPASESAAAAAARHGFSANFSFVTDFGIKAGSQDQTMDCAFTFSNKETSNGTFTSPNFPGLYPRNVQCHYLFYKTPV